MVLPYTGILHDYKEGGGGPWKDVHHESLSEKKQTVERYTW